MDQGTVCNRSWTLAAQILAEDGTSCTRNDLTELLLFDVRLPRSAAVRNIEQGVLKM